MTIKIKNSSGFLRVPDVGDGTISNHQGRQKAVYSFTVNGNVFELGGAVTRQWARR